MFDMTRVVLSGLLLILVAGRAQCLDASITFNGGVRHFSVGFNSVYVVTEERLYRLSRNLTLLQSLSQRGIFEKGTSRDEERFRRVSGTQPSNAKFTVNTLISDVKNNHLITCGVIECGYCELLDPDNISKVLYQEGIDVGPVRSNSASVGFLVDLKTSEKTETNILTAIQPGDKVCASSAETVNIQNTNHGQTGEIFSYQDGSGPAHIMVRKDKDGKDINVTFVDGFQVNSTIFLFSNIPSNDRISLIYLKSNGNKAQVVKSMRGATLKCCEDTVRSTLRGSSVVPGGPPVLWAGVFEGRNPKDRFNTALAVFDISPPEVEDRDTDPDFHSSGKQIKGGSTRTLEPIKVLFEHNSLTSVLAVRQKTWLVFFMGTADGQLYKLAVDRNYHTICPRVLYRANDERQVFPRMHLDPVDRKHVYVVLRDQMRRISMSRCENSTSLQDCWSAQDPFCGWCVSKRSCTLEEECPNSVWLTIPDDTRQKKMFSLQVEKDTFGQIKLTMILHLGVGGTGVLTGFSCMFLKRLGEVGELCAREGPTPQFPRCSCLLSNSTLPSEGLEVTVRVRLDKEHLSEQLELTDCSDITGPPTSVLCHQCITAGCSWSNNVCSWRHTGFLDDGVCQMAESGLNYSKPVISSIHPNVLSFYGRNNAVMTGGNLTDVIRVRFQGDIDCLKESAVWNITGESLVFHIPRGDKGIVNVCAVLPDGSCHGTASITYLSLPSCTGITPSTAWASGKRKITIHGSHLEFVEGIVHSHAPRVISIARSSNSTALIYEAPAAENVIPSISSTVSVRVVNTTLDCTKMTYLPDPEFLDFTTTKTGNDLRITLQKVADKLNITADDLSVVGVQGEEEHECEIENIELGKGTDSVICEIRNTPVTTLHSLKITFGGATVECKGPSSILSLLMCLVLLLIPCIIIAVLCIYRKQQMKFTAQMNRRIEDLELDIRNDIRQGFVDLQTEKSDLIENVGAIPFLDYKHFASRIFFPKGGPLMTSCIHDIGQGVVKVQPEASCQALSRLIQDQLFLTTMVHALEGQKSFTVENKCAVASLLTVALHGDLPYLTQVMEGLLRDLMEQPNNTQPKLLLRRTESIVEKLLTNWMSVCLYGFLRESVGQHLFLLVSALIQQTAKGPVDSVTEKALYTLSEDWLLWQAQDFTPLKLKVLFAVGVDGEVSEPLEVNTLSCDTIEQLKQKILSSFKAKFGFPYNTPLRDIYIKYEKEGSFIALEEVDASSEVLGEVTMLNTLKHYKVPDGATIKVLSQKTHPPLSPQGSLKDDQDFSVKYFHLIDPDVDEAQKKNPERKKLKLKEVHLTKLLSTKVAVHSFVENLFRAIWGTPQNRAPQAVKYFFDFLDVQAENKKITDPDVLHIWKTNSLPLRFWVNILKNPHFLFDMEQTPHLDGCLNVIAQAFMDSFSLSEMQLGKHAPTNKLLYAKDIPQFKQEVKAYYKHVKDQPSITSAEFKDFLLEESKKHEDEFNESAALRELYKFIQKYFTEIKEKLDQDGAPAELKEQLQHVKNLFDGLKSCSWN